MQCGMFVPAEEASAPMSAKTFSHITSGRRMLP